MNNSFSFGHFSHDAFYHFPPPFFVKRNPVLLEVHCYGQYSKRFSGRILCKGLSCSRIFNVKSGEKKVFPYGNFALFTSIDYLPWPITHIHTELSDRKLRDQTHTQASYQTGIQYWPRMALRHRLHQGSIDQKGSKKLLSSLQGFGVNLGKSVGFVELLDITWKRHVCTGLPVEERFERLVELSRHPVF